eukprot:gene23938-9505_t
MSGNEMIFTGALSSCLASSPNLSVRFAKSRQPPLAFRCQCGMTAISISLSIRFASPSHSTRVSTAPDRKTALKFLASTNGASIDVVLKEHEPPGADACRFLRSIARSTINVPVIVMSSQNDPECVMKCMTTGALDYLVKPLRLNELRLIWTRVWFWKKSKLSYNLLCSPQNGSDSQDNLDPNSVPNTSYSKSFDRDPTSDNTNDHSSRGDTKPSEAVPNNTQVKQISLVPDGEGQAGSRQGPSRELSGGSKEEESSRQEFRAPKTYQNRTGSGSDENTTTRQSATTLDPAALKNAIARQAKAAEGTTPSKHVAPSEENTRAGTSPSRRTHARPSCATGIQESSTATGHAFVPYNQSATFKMASSVLLSPSYQNAHCQPSEEVTTGERDLASQDPEQATGGRNKRSVLRPVAEKVYSHVQKPTAEKVYSHLQPVAEKVYSHTTHPTGDKAVRPKRVHTALAAPALPAQAPKRGKTHAVETKSYAHSHMAAPLPKSETHVSTLTNMTSTESPTVGLRHPSVVRRPSLLISSAEAGKNGLAQRASGSMCSDAPSNGGGSMQHLIALQAQSMANQQAAWPAISQTPSSTSGPATSNPMQLPNPWLMNQPLMPNMQSLTMPTMAPQLPIDPAALQALMFQQQQQMQQQQLLATMAPYNLQNQQLLPQWQQAQQQMMGGPMVAPDPQQQKAHFLAKQMHQQQQHQHMFGMDTSSWTPDAWQADRMGMLPPAPFAKHKEPEAASYSKAVAKPSKAPFNTQARAEALARWREKRKRLNHLGPIRYENRKRCADARQRVHGRFVSSGTASGTPSISNEE